MVNLMLSMKKIFLIVMLFLLPLQYTWAMVASYDTHDAQDTEVHFGHHEHNTNTSLFDLDIDSNLPENQDTQNLDSHVHLGFFHLSCGDLIGYALPVFEQQALQMTTPYLFTYRSPPNYQPERPNWVSLV